MRGGTHEWAIHGGAAQHVRYMEQRPKRRGGQPRCHCGCNTLKTHLGMANGVCLTSGCELYVRRWVKTAGIRTVRP